MPVLYLDWRTSQLLCEFTGHVNLNVYITRAFLTTRRLLSDWEEYRVPHKLDSVMSCVEHALRYGNSTPRLWNLLNEIRVEAIACGKFTLGLYSSLMSITKATIGASDYPHMFAVAMLWIAYLDIINWELLLFV